MHLFIDTETSGLLDPDLPLDHPAQPRIIQLAAWLGDWEEAPEPHLRHVASLNAVIKPRGWTVSDGALRVHGITTEYATAFGEEVEDVIERLYLLLEQADERMGLGKLIGHNLSFDNRMVLREAMLCGRDVTTLGILRPFCTMRALTGLMRLPGKRPGQLKWPSLDEAYEWCFKRPVPGDRSQRHNAMEDCLACKDIYEHGKRQEWWQ